MTDRTPFEKPTPLEIRAAKGREVADVIARGLDILFCGINPGLYSGAVGHHFARPGNRFWKALHRSGITPRRLEPWEESLLIEHGCGITNLVKRATASADELGEDELQKGRRRLAAKAGFYKPRTVAVLGISAYRIAFRDKEAGLGLQAKRMGHSEVWVLPNPSGLNAHYQLPQLARMFREVRQAVRG